LIHFLSAILLLPHFLSTRLEQKHLPLFVTCFLGASVQVHATAMNDPGLDDPIATAASHVQENHDNEVAGSDVGEEEEEKNYLLPARWWWASTAFPLIAGTFGPMANAFNICALVEKWRVKIPQGGTEEHGIDIPTPKW
jgi:hypothetical protein